MVLASSELSTARRQIPLRDEARPPGAAAVAPRGAQQLQGSAAECGAERPQPGRRGMRHHHEERGPPAARLLRPTAVSTTLGGGTAADTVFSTGVCLTTHTYTYIHFYV